MPNNKTRTFYRKEEKSVHIKGPQTVNFAMDNAVITKEEELLKKKQELERELKKQQKMAEQLKREAEAAKKRMEAEQEALKIQLTCLKIAGRIMAGDRVPGKDHQYLVKHDPSLYGKAFMMKITKENPKEHKQLSGEEENNARSSHHASSELQNEMAVDIKI